MNRLALFALPLLTLTGVGCKAGLTKLDEEKAAAQRTYSGLAGQRVATMVWADFTIRTEFNRVQYDLAEAVQAVLVTRTRPSKEEKRPQLPGPEFLNAGSVVRYQREHPETQSLPITEVAPRLGVPRVIYIELEEFRTQPPQSAMLLKGSAKAAIRVIEVEGGKAKVAFEARDISVIYPPNAPEGVVPSDRTNLRTIYDGTVRVMAQRIAEHFREKKD